MAPKKPAIDAPELMIVNDSPGEECRIAVLQDGHLEEIYTERSATATDVGNIYKGRVVNVEPAIQAAFIDYGQGANGFLHISDLHPKYFPGEERTERVGKKIPRRDRPPIQAALKRGQEILVQVLKEGIGSKGPTLTSYLSIPGRLLVLMPDMDRVGVSRKVEDEQKRREMREILDSLGLPDGFGFILRTAGFGRPKMELKRDAAYLMRLWKVMAKRIESVGAPCELYTESDLLIRTIRDVLRPSISAVVVDSESAYDRVNSFLRVVAPRSAPKVVRYNRPPPIFHAFDVERQIELIHSGEVPLASGGRLVIDQTEALVAIDVNSGRSRSARDSETNAYETNIEAADEICRQLRLRDLGGLIVNDLIDMRSHKHRRAIEERFVQNLKKDRAKATCLQISDFGILEMTRQRMRPSIRKSHFMACPHCNGHGEIKAPEYVASDAARHVGFLLQFERVDRVELVCSPRVASVLLSRKRRELVRLEDTSGKRVDVRVSDAIAADRVDYYAYDDRNADIDLTKLPPLRLPSIEELEAEALVAPAADDDKVGEGVGSGRRRRRRTPGPADATAIALAGDFDDYEFEDEEEEEIEPGAAAIAAASPSGNGEAAGVKAQRPQDDSKRGRRHRRRRGGGRGGGTGDEGVAAGASTAQSNRIVPEAQSDRDALTPAPTDHGLQHGEEGGKRRRRRRRRRGGARTQDGAPTAPVQEQVDQPSHGGSAASSGETPPVRIHELARELSVSSKELIERCDPDPAIHPLASPLATVSPAEADTIRSMFENPPDGSDSAAAGSTAATTAGEQRSNEPGRKRSRRGRRGGRRDKRAEAIGIPVDNAPEGASNEETIEGVSQSADQPAHSDEASHEEHGGTVAGDGGSSGRKRRRRRRGRGGGGGGSGGGAAPSEGGPGDGQRRGAQAPESPLVVTIATGQPIVSIPDATVVASPKKKRRALYRAGRLPLSPAVRGAISEED